MWYTVPRVDVWVSIGGPASRVDTTKEHEDSQGHGTEGRLIAYVELFQIARAERFPFNLRGLMNPANKMAICTGSPRQEG